MQIHNCTPVYLMEYKSLDLINGVCVSFVDNMSLT